MKKQMNAGGFGVSLLRTACLVTTLGVLAAACAEPESGDGRTRETASAIVDSNAMNPNALNANALNANAMNPNALNANALNPNALSSAALAAITDPGTGGNLSRELLKYTVSCALTTSQSFAFSWTDVHSVVHAESYPGLLGLASSWASSALGTTGQYWVSACLASRVNWYGATVSISSRGNTSQLATGYYERMVDYPNIEGAFFGNLFSSTPAIYSCYNQAHAYDSNTWQRDCATGHLNSNNTRSNCGILTVLGDCADYCSAITGNGYLYDDQYYSTCYSTLAHTSGSLVSQVVTTALPTPLF